MFFLPALILTFFFLVQITVKIINDDPNTDEVSFIERLLLGPAKVIVAMSMVGGGIAIENHFWGGLWIGTSLLFLYFGFQDIRQIVRMSRPEAVGAATLVTAKQRDKTEKDEDALLADLASFFTKDDDTEEGTK